MPPKRKTPVTDTAPKEEKDEQLEVVKKNKTPTSKAVDATPKAPVEIKIKNDYPKYYVDTPSDKKLSLFQQVVDEENRFRELFAQDRQNKYLDDPHLMMVDAHQNLEIFKYVQETEAEKKIPRIFERQKNSVPEPTTPYCVVDYPEFQRNWTVFTEDQFKYLNWNNVLAAGGSVLASLCPVPAEYAENNHTRRAYFHKDAYKNSDIDLFIYGLETEEEANKKIEEVYAAIREGNPETIIAFRSQHAITIISQFPYRHIQLVLRLYKSPAEVLMGFDVDCCSVGYDGKKVWVLPRAHRALTHRYNTVDMTRRSPSYEMRLAKYSSRGFSVLVPQFDAARVDPQLFERRFDQLQGLARLLLLEKLETPEARYRYKEQQRLRKLRPESKQRESFLAQLDPTLDEDEYSRERLEEQGGANASDYSTVFLPWGPNWNAEKVRRLMYTKDMVLNSKWYDAKKKIHTHPCFIGTMSEVIHDCCGHCPVIPPEEVDPDSPYVSGKVVWVTVNPGSQTVRIGSFHPITEGDWTEEAYINAEAESLFTAINSDNAKAVKQCIEEGVDVNARDSAGRTPLVLAAYSNSPKCAKLLIENGARISAKIYDGRTALHIASAYGHDEIVKLILERGNQLADKKDDMDVDKKKKDDTTKTKDKASKSKAPKSKTSKKKKKKQDSDDDMDEDEDEDASDDMDVDEEQEDEENEDDDDSGEFQGIKSIIDKKKKEQAEQLAALDPVLDDKSKDDVLELDIEDWDNRFTPLHYAIYFGHVKIIELLAKGGAKVDKSLEYEKQIISPLALGLSSRNFKEVIGTLLNNKVPINHVDSSYDTVLHKAVALRNFEAVKFLLESKFDLKVDAQNARYETPLVIAVNNLNRNTEAKKLESDINIVKYLINKGKATCHFTEKNLPSKSEKQQQKGKKKVKEGGNKIQKLRSAFTQPIEAAASTGFIDIVQLLLDNGADACWISSRRRTPVDAVDQELQKLQRRDPNFNSDSDSEDDEEKDALGKKLKKVDKDSWEYNELNQNSQNSKKDRKRKKYYYGKTPKYATPKYSSSKVDKNKSKEEEEEEKKQEEQRQKDIKDHLAVRKLLIKYHGLPFHLVKLDADEDEYLISQQQHIKKYQQGLALNWVDEAFGDGKKKITKKKKAVKKSKTPKKKQDEIRVLFQTFSAQRNRWNKHTDVDDEELPAYMELYEAVWEGDIKTVENLTIKKPIGSQVHVASISSFSNRTPLHLAVERNNPKMLEKLIHIMVKQYTPLAPLIEVEKGDAPSINNYELSKIMQNFKPGKFVDKKGLSKHKEYKTQDPNAPMIQLNCITPPCDVFESSDSEGFTVFHRAVALNYIECLDTMISTIDDRDIKLEVDDNDDEDDYYSRRKKSAGPRKEKGNLIQHLIIKSENVNLKGEYKLENKGKVQLNGDGDVTPIQLAVLLGNTKIIGLFIEHGGLGQTMTNEKDEDDEIYEGLNIGGKKMDWVEKHHASKKPQLKYNTLLHYAAASGQTHSFKFLMNEARKIWENCKLYDHNHPPVDMDILVSVTERDETPLHSAILESNIEGVKIVLEECKKKAKNVFEYILEAKLEGLTPLMLACQNGEEKIVQILLEAGADLNAKHEETHWNCLHYALGNELIVEMLLKQKDLSFVNGLSKYYHHTPLMVAAYRGFDETVKLLIACKNVDVSLKDICGNTALYLAIVEDHKEVVQLLLKETKHKTQENGLGITPLDAAMLKSVRLLDPDTFSESQELYQVVADDVKTAQRELVKTEYIYKLSNVLIEQANNNNNEDNLPKKKFKFGYRRKAKRRTATDDIFGMYPEPSISSYLSIPQFENDEQ